MKILLGATGYSKLKENQMDHLINLRLDLSLTVSLKNRALIIRRFICTSCTIPCCQITSNGCENSILQGTLDVDIYMKQPNAYYDREKSEYVCTLRKSIYGLKQAARCWNIAIDEFLNLNGFKMSGADTCLYVKTVKDVNGKINFVILALFVDDILLMSNSTDMVARAKESLSKRFKISDQGEVHSILGMLIQRDRKERTLTISQPKYLEGVLKRFKMENCEQVSTPLEPV